MENDSIVDQLAEENKKLQDIIKYLLENCKKRGIEFYDIPPEFKKVLNDNFWDLI